MGDKLKLTPKQSRFIQEYLIDLNATQAAIRAGYSKKTANEQGCQNLAKLSIAEEIKRLQGERENETGITQNRILRELAVIAFSDQKDFLTIDPDTGVVRAKGFENIPENASRAIESIEENRAIKEDSKGDSSVVFDKFKFKLYDKLRALELLMRHNGMLKNEMKGDLNVDLHFSYDAGKE
jgi:phage terminase small subunit